MVEDCLLCTHFILCGQGVEHLMLHQLIVAVGATARTLAGGLRICMPPRGGNLCVRRLEAEAVADVLNCLCFRRRLAPVPVINAAAVVCVHAAAIAIYKRERKKL